jgi:hypothetical protein
MLRWLTEAASRLFATPFAAVNTGASRLQPPAGEPVRIATSAPSRPEDPTRDPLHFRSPDDFLDSSDATAGELKRLILGQASTIVASLSSIDIAEFAKLHIQARGWCSIVQRNGHVPAQHFPGVSWRRGVLRASWRIRCRVQERRRTTPLRKAVGVDVPGCE